MKTIDTNQATKELMKLLLQAKIPSLLPLQQTVLMEVLGNGKSFTEIEGIVKLSASQQKVIFENGISILLFHLKKMNEKLAVYNEMEKELNELKHWKRLLETNLEKLKVKEIDPELKHKIGISIQSINFSGRLSKILYNAKIKTVADLVKVSKHDLLKERNCGKGSIDEIESYFKKNKLWWDMEV
jgi:hypothetical protein